jgi:hypothetical protein
VAVRFSAPVQTGPWAHPASVYNGSSVPFLEVKGRGVALTTDQQLAPRLKKKWSYTSTSPLGLHGLFQGKRLIYLFQKYKLQTGPLHVATRSRENHLFKPVRDKIASNLLSSSFSILFYETQIGHLCSPAIEFQQK